MVGGAAASLFEHEFKNPSVKTNAIAIKNFIFITTVFKLLLFKRKDTTILLPAVLKFLMPFNKC